MRQVNPESLLVDLNEEQRAAVATPSSLVAVIAGAGSGKTRVLTRRIAYRVANGTAAPEHTVVMTFTREAAGELKRRLPRLGVSSRVVAGTFHAIAQQLLRQRWNDLDQPPRTILQDRSHLIRTLAGDERAEPLIADISWATARGITPDDYVTQAKALKRRSNANPGRVAEVFAHYVAEKAARRVVDLDDLIALTSHEIEHYPDYAEALRWRFRHVLIDEAQDLNPIQQRFVDLLRHGRDDVFLVGDPAQSIYGFNGSDPTLLVDIETRFAGVEVIRLATNHRCTPEIIDAGRHVLAAADQPVDLAASRNHGAAVTITNHDDEQHEALEIARLIGRDCDPSDIRHGHVAVLARTHAVLRGVRANLGLAGIPVQQTSDAANTPLGRLVIDAGRVSSPNDLRRFAFDAADTAESSDDPRFQVAEVVQQFLREQPTGDGAAFRSWLLSHDPFNTHAGGVVLQTFHGAKGREWDTVYVAGCETSLVPHRSAKTVAQKAEEARLLYVAITRGRDRVSIHHAGRRDGYQRKLSPFLEGFVSAPPQPTARGERAPTKPVVRDGLHDRAVAWRANMAQQANVLPEEFCDDHLLKLIAAVRPTGPEQLDELTGVGTLTARRWWPTLSTMYKTQ